MFIEAGAAIKTGLPHAFIYIFTRSSSTGKLPPLTTPAVKVYLNQMKSLLRMETLNMYVIEFLFLVHTLQVLFSLTIDRTKTY